MATDWITTAEAAELSGYHIVHLRRLIRAGRVGAEKRGRDWWIDRKSLLAHIKSAEKSGDKRRGAKSH